jgi:hypothetical protein
VEEHWEGLDDNLKDINISVSESEIRKEQNDRKAVEEQARLATT